MSTPLLSALTGDPETEALLSDRARLLAMVSVERALAEASAAEGWISSEAAAAVASAIDGFEPGWQALAAGMVKDGVEVPALLAQLRARMPEAHRSALHRGATSQDIIDTALVLQLAKVLDVLVGRLDAIVAILNARIASDGNRVLVAHTRMQVALPTHWRVKLEGWRAPLLRERAALDDLRPRLLVVQLGGPVGDRASFGGHGDAIAAGMARRLGLGNGAPWQTARDSIATLGGLLATVSGSLGKVGADVALLAQSEIQAVAIPGGSSSAMPHKSNPVSAEVLVALARYNAGLAGTLQQAMVHEHERSGAAWTLEWLVLPQMAIVTAAGLRLAVDLLSALTIAGESNG